MANSTTFNNVIDFAREFRGVIRRSLWNMVGGFPIQCRGRDTIFDIEGDLIECPDFDAVVAGEERLHGSIWTASDEFEPFVDSVVREGFQRGLAPDLHILYVELGRPGWFLSAAQNEVELFVRDLVQNLVLSEAGTVGFLIYPDFVTALQDDSLWLGGITEVTDRLRNVDRERSREVEVVVVRETNMRTYPFSPYRPRSVNLGLQLVYRQRWVPLGTQEGEILRTLPLGPKQTEKVTVKAVRRTKSTRQAEIVTSIETATESSAATKDSQEVIREASESFNWHVEASAEASWGWGSASVEAGAGGEEARSSKDAKTTLNETMEKTASKVKQDTKIVISTEVEETSEFARTSEISNPNDELAVTYVYSRLQRQYEIHTYLSEVNTCIFVAEWMPKPAEITGAFIRRYDWIIAQALLDESFRADLEVIRAHDPDDPNREVEPEDKRIRSLMESLSGPGSEGETAPGLPTQYSSLEGTLPDIFATPQNAYERELERKRGREKDHEAYERAVRRLRQHIFDNILHYMRAIWSAEDTDARLMRYQQKDVPTWGFRPTGYDEDGNIDGDWANGPAVPLSELINPAGPIGYAGNYAVFYLKQDGRYPDLEAAVEQLRYPYLRHRGVGAYLGTTDAAGDLRPEPPDDVEIAVAVSPNRRGGGRYRLIWDATAGEMKVDLEKVDEADVFVRRSSVSPSADGLFEFDNLKVKIKPSGFSEGATFEIDVYVDPILEDPELRQIRFSQTPMDLGQEPSFYTAEVLAEHAEFYPDVEQALDAAGATSWTELDADEETRNLVRNRLAEYLLRKRHTRRLVLDTNNVLLSLMVDNTSIIEPFKRYHRYIDVLSALADVERKQIENRRRDALIAAGRLGDPDVEKLTLVSSTDGFGELAVLDGITPDSVESSGSGG